MWPPSLTALTFVKLAVVVLGVFNLVLMFAAPGLSRNPRSLSVAEPLPIYVRNHPELRLLHLDVPAAMRPVELITEETAHYPVHGILADAEWASLVPEGNHGLVLLGPDDAVPRPYAIAMFHTLHCLDRIRMAIVSPPSPSPSPSPSTSKSSPPLSGSSGRQGTVHGRTRTAQARARYHVHHCFNYLRQMVLCAANTRLNPTNHVQPSGQLASDGIGLTYQCRDWNAVYDAFDANYALNRTMVFAR